METIILKKFYRDFTDEEIAYIESVLSDMRKLDLDIPGYVIDRMLSRHIIDPGEVMILLSLPVYKEIEAAAYEGAVYEFSNEAAGKSDNPFRVVVAREGDDGYTYFVKLVPSETTPTLEVLDVWRKRGPIPEYPPQHAANHFSKQWDIIESMEMYFDSLDNLTTA